MDQNDVNFRPSPNFKNMKKYSKSNNHIMEKDTANVSTSTEPQETNPPLPPYPPPDVQIKEEVVDDSYDNQTEKMSEKKTQENEATNTEVVKKETMCKNFFRGACNRGASCIFAHKVILTQLSDVYRFCNDFQNSKCTRPKCRFVHATVFEKEHFLRTGYLPPHALEHVKDVNKPLVSSGKAESAETEPDNMNVPDTSAVSLSSSMPPPAIPAPTTNVYAAPAAAQGPSFADAWVPYEASANQQVQAPIVNGSPETCNECNVNEFSYQYNKNKVENLMKGLSELEFKTFDLDEKTERLMTVIESMTHMLNIPQAMSLLNSNQAQDARSK